MTWRKLLVRLLLLAVFAALIALIVPGLSSVRQVTFHPGCQVAANGVRVCTAPGAEQSSGVVPLPEPFIWVSAAILWLVGAILVLRKRDQKLPDRVPCF